MFKLKVPTLAAIAEFTVMFVIIAAIFHIFPQAKLWEKLPVFGAPRATSGS